MEENEILKDEVVEEVVDSVAENADVNSAATNEVDQVKELRDSY